MRRKMAEALLEIKAVSLRPDNPYTWASGIRSPIYCDNRLTLSYPELRREIARGLADIIRGGIPRCGDDHGYSYGRYPPCSPCGRGAGFAHGIRAGQCQGPW